jgi:hypothetical protein
VSILKAGMASKQGSITLGRKGRHQTTSLLTMCVPRRDRASRATPPYQASLSLLAILYLLLFLFLPHSIFYAPPKNIAQKKNLFPNFFFSSPIFFAPIFVFDSHFFFCSQNFFLAPNCFLGSLIPRATYCRTRLR